eukprot:465900-Rhodomonas_salina.2
MLMHCEVTKQAHLRAHDSIADPLDHSIAEAAPWEWAVWTRPVVWKIEKLLGETPHPQRTAVRLSKGTALHTYPTTPWAQMQWAVEASMAICPEDIALFTLDGLLWHHLDKRIVIYEFSRCMGTEAADMEEQHTQKAQAYHALQLYLQCLLPDHSVELCTYVMSITGSVPEGRWGENLPGQAMGIAQHFLLQSGVSVGLNT